MARLRWRLILYTPSWPQRPDKGTLTFCSYQLFQFKRYNSNMLGIAVHLNRYSEFCEWVLYLFGPLGYQKVNS